MSLTYRTGGDPAIFTQLANELQYHHKHVWAELVELASKPYENEAMNGVLSNYCKLKVALKMPLTESAPLFLKRLKEKRLGLLLDTVVTPGGITPIADFDLPDVKDAWI